MSEHTEKGLLTEADESALLGALVRHSVLIEKGTPVAMVQAHHESGVYVAVEQIVREHRQAAYAEAVQAFRNLHLTHGNTGGCYGGLGGAAITSECAIDCPNPKHEKAQHAWRNVELQALGMPPEPYVIPPDEGRTSGGDPS
jgi:hypothetical protein